MSAHEQTGQIMFVYLNFMINFKHSLFEFSQFTQIRAKIVYKLMWT